MSDFLHQISYQHNRIKKYNDGWKVPVTVVCGFLGSGKTTTVNHIASLPGAETFDVFIREYALVSVDEKLIKGVPLERIHVNSGVSEHIDEETMLYIAMDRLHEERHKKFSRLILETSGAEDPEIFRHLFFLWDMPQMYDLSTFITVVDSEYGEMTLDEFECAAQQIALADTVLINKTDLADEESLRHLEARIRGINIGAHVIRTRYGNISMDDAKGLSLYELLKNVTSDKDVICMDKIRSYALEVEEPLDKAKTNVWINALFNQYGSTILRSKGFMNFAGEDYRYEFQAVRKTFHSYANDVWPGDEPRKTSIVLIGTELPEKEALEAGLRACIA